MYNPWQTRTISKAMETRLKLRDLGIFTEHSQMMESDLEEYKIAEDSELSAYVHALVSDSDHREASKLEIAKSRARDDQGECSTSKRANSISIQDEFRKDLCPHFLRGKCRFKKFCRFSHILTVCPYCREDLPLNRVSASAHLSRCWKRDGQDESQIFQQLTIYTLGNQQQ